MERYRNTNTNLPEELVNHILLRLPVKTLLVCKCVCKAWCALIKSPSFVNQHFGHKSNQHCLLFRSHCPIFLCGEHPYAYNMYEDDESHSRVEVSNHLTQLPTGDGFLDLIGPENGIFCVVSTRKRIGLLNPAIREFKTLPPHPLHDPASFCSVFGFGFDPSSGDFKVVAFERSLYTSFAFVYNLSNDLWKRVDSVEALDLFAFVDYSSNHLILNGVNYWLMKYYANRAVPSIVAFDMRTEKFQEISIPDALRSTSWFDLRITEYGDSIALMLCKHMERLDLWVRGRDGLWSKSFIVGPFQGYMRSVCMWKKKMVFFLSSSSSLKMCDISTQKITTILPESTPDYECEHFIYRESLVSIKGERADNVVDFFD